MLRHFTAHIVLFAYLFQILSGCGADIEPSETSALRQTARSPLAIPTDYDLLPTEDNAYGLGDTPATFDVSPSGEAQYSVPLWVSPGRAGIQPSLALAYSSGSGNGLLGVGWGLVGLSSIMRCRKTVASDGQAAPVTFTASDAYCLDGRKLLPIGTGSHPVELRPEQDPSTRVLMYFDDLGPTYFEVYGRDGLIRSYGRHDTSRLEGQRVRMTASPPTDNVITTTEHARVTWALSEVRDRSGNYLRISYLIDQAAAEDGTIHYEQLPYEIRYTGFDGAASPVAPTRSVIFSYDESRPDSTFGYFYGFPTKSTRRLSRIEMLGPGLGAAEVAGVSSTLRVYHLTYGTPSITRRSLLQSVQECDGRGPDLRGVCKAPILLRWDLGCADGTISLPALGGGSSTSGCANPLVPAYEDIDTGITNVTHHAWDESLLTLVPQIPDFWTLQTGDINGDGFDDILYRIPQVNSELAIVSTDWYYRLSTGRGFGLQRKAELPRAITGAPIEDLTPVIT